MAVSTASTWAGEPGALPGSHVVSDDKRVYNRSQSSNNDSAFLLGFIFSIKALSHAFLTSAENFLAEYCLLRFYRLSTKVGRVIG